MSKPAPMPFFCRAWWRWLLRESAWLMMRVAILTIVNMAIKNYFGLSLGYSLWLMLGMSVIWEVCEIRHEIRRTGRWF